MSPSNIAVSIRARLLNKARAEKLDYMRPIRMPGFLAAARNKLLLIPFWLLLSDSIIRVLEGALVRSLPDSRCTARSQ